MALISPRLGAQIVKETLSILRDPRNRIMLVAPPLVQLLILSFAITLEVDNVDVAVLDRDAGAYSTEFVSRIDGSGFVDDLRIVGSEAEMRHLIEQSEVIAGISIPETFSRDIGAGDTAMAQVIIDGRRANSGQIAFSYLNTIAATLDAELRHAPEGDVAAVRHWFNPNLISQWFVVPGITGILMTIQALLLTALSIARERELGTFDQLMVSPTTPLEIIAAKAVPAMVIGFIMGLVMMGAGIVIFQVPFTGSFPLLLLSLFIYIFSMIGMGLMISAICATQQQAILGAFALVVPMVLMSGFATPVENMPVVLQWAAHLIPLKYMLVILTGTFVKALPPEDVFANLWPMAVISLVSLTIATIFVRRRLQ